MTEQEYIDATNLAKIRIAYAALVDCYIEDDSCYKNIQVGCIMDMYNLIRELEKKIECSE